MKKAPMVPFLCLVISVTTEVEEGGRDATTCTLNHNYVTLCTFLWADHLQFHFSCRLIEW